MVWLLAPNPQTDMQNTTTTANTMSATIETLDCGHAATPTECAPGYGVSDGLKMCFACCGKAEKEFLITRGHGMLYLTGQRGEEKLTDWPGVLIYRPSRVSHSRHNIGRTRTDVWFTGPDNKRWHGVQIGENNQVCRVHRLKKQ